LQCDQRFQTNGLRCQKKKENKWIRKKPDAYRIVSYRQLVQFDSAACNQDRRFTGNRILFYLKMADAHIHGATCHTYTNMLLGWLVAGANLL
jgi:hypothetical protein